MTRIYLDHAATTPLGEPARQAMQPWLSESGFGNASSLYQEGRAARDAIDQAREALSSHLGCLFAEALFTGSGTEAANLAVIGTALAHMHQGRDRILVSAVEHHCVLHTESIVRKLGYRFETIPVNDQAQIDLDWLESALDERVLLISVQHANNETGTLQPIETVSPMAQRVGARFHVDAVQTLGKISPPFPDLADFVTFSAHKIQGPKGVGAIYVRAGNKPQPLIVGGGQEREVRAGTENVAAIAGFGAAVRNLSPLELGLSDAFLSELDVEFKATLRPETATLASHVHLRFPGVGAESLLIRLDRAGVSASSGAACSSGSLEPSHVLMAMGFDEHATREGVRFTFGPTSTLQEAREGGRRVAEAVRSIRAAR